MKLITVVKRHHDYLGQLFVVKLKVMEQYFFAFSLIIEGTTEKVSQIIMPLKSIYNRNVSFIEQKLYFWTLRRVSSKKNPINWHYFFAMKKVLVDLFRAAPYMFVLALHKDVLFHSKIVTRCLMNTPPPMFWHGQKRIKENEIFWPFWTMKIK